MFEIRKFRNLFMKLTGDVRWGTHLRFATGYTEGSERCPHASVRIVELLKRRSCGISIQCCLRITQHIRMRSCGWMMWRQIVWRIRADRRSRDQRFAGTRWLQTARAGAATTCRPYIHHQTRYFSFSKLPQSYRAIPITLTTRLPR